MVQHCKMMDLEGGLVAPEPVEERRTPDTSPASRGWRIYLALLAIGLCAAAAIFFSVHNQKQDISMGNVDLKHSLRQLRYGSTNPRRVIHVVGTYNSTIDAVQWHTNEELSYVGEGLRLDRNEIVIPSPGLYFVYSQVSFEINCNHPPLTDTSPELERYYLSHKVVRSTTKLPRNVTLLSASRSGCMREPAATQDSGRRWYGTINVEAIFKLSKDDRLSTETEHASEVAGGFGKTYFGVFAV